MKRTDAQKQEPTRAARSNQPFFGTKSATAFFATGQSVQRDPFFQSSNAPLTTPIQAKLTVGAVGDKYEQEADRVASEVVDRINNPSVQQGGDTQSVQRMGEEEDEVQMKSAIADMAKGGDVSPNLETSIQQARGSGQPIAERVRVPLEQAFGADFSGVRVHTDSKSDQLNQSIQAKAFTTGQDVFFRQGAYEPGSRSGQELIAHELTHVVQQRGGHIQRRSTSSVGAKSQQWVLISGQSYNSGVIRRSFENIVRNPQGAQPQPGQPRVKVRVKHPNLALSAQLRNLIWRLGSGDSEVLHQSEKVINPPTPYVGFLHDYGTNTILAISHYSAGFVNVAKSGSVSGGMHRFN